MSKAALYSGLSGAFEGVKDAGLLAYQEQLSERSAEAELIRRKKLAEYESGLRKDEESYALDLELSHMRTKQKEGLLNTKAGTGDWKEVTRKDEFGNERVFLYNDLTGEIKDPFDADGNVSRPPADPTWDEAIATAKADYGVDISNDEIAEGFAAQGDWDAVEKRILKLQNQSGGNPGETKSTPPMEAATASLRAALEPNKGPSRQRGPQGERTDAFAGIKSFVTNIDHAPSKRKSPSKAGGLLNQAPQQAATYEIQDLPRLIRDALAKGASQEEIMALLTNPEHQEVARQVFAES